jgi:pseudouridine kinase
MVEVVVIGGANIDMKAKAMVAHKLGTSNPGTVSMTPGGVARNIAHNLARLGNKVALISCVGSDAHGDAALAETASAGVDISAVSRSHTFPTGTYVALLDGNGDLVSAVSDMRIMETLTPDTITDNSTALSQARLIIADCNLPLNTLQTLAEHYGQKLVIDPVSVEKSKKLAEVLRAHDVYMATPNRDQAEALFGSRNLFELPNRRLHNMVIHAGPEGAVVFSGKTATRIPAVKPTEIIDVTGAGDAATAGLAHGLLQGLSPEEAAALGQQTASRVIASAKSTLE